MGGGFAGTVAALTLLERSPELRVSVHERESAAHTTLCGEGLSEDTLRAFSAFDSRPYIAQSFDEAVWFFPGRDGPAATEVRIHQRGHTMARESWIPAMAAAAAERGARYVTDDKVDAARIEAWAAEPATLVVGCDGPGSVTRKVVGGTHTTMLGIQYRVAPAPDDVVPERLEFYTDKMFSPEYSWVFPRGDIMNVGLLATGDGQDWARLDAFMAARGIAGKVVKREAYPIGFFGDKVQGGERGNVVLVGDAAGLTNPITKGGMAATIYAAQMLADCVAADTVADYGQRIFSHPIADPSFGPALATIRAWSNADFARLLRFAPRPIHVDPGRSTEGRYWWRLAATLASNLDKTRDIRRLAHAFGVSRRYSW